MARPGKDAINSEKFITLPKLNVTNQAETLGFTSKVSFLDKNVVKFYKVMPLVNKVFRYASRNCAKQNGRLVSAYDQSTMQTLIEALNLDEDYILTGIAKRHNLLPDLEANEDKKSWIYENGLTFLEEDVMENCPFISSVPSTEQFAAYSAEDGKLVAFNEE